jgi:putative metallohydrolase (TIGR04338 family)
MRDNQKSRLYAAERDVFGSSWDNKPDFKTLPECQEFLDKVFKAKVFQRHYPMADGLNILLRPGKRARRAYATIHVKDGVRYNSITLPLVFRNRWLILHELSHHLTNMTTKGGNYTHNHQFATIYLDLIGMFLGTETRRELKRAYMKRKVYTYEKKPAAHTEEHRKMLSDRMKAINAAKKAAKAANPADQPE